MHNEDQGGRGCVYSPIYHLAHQADWNGIRCSDTPDAEFPRSCTAHADIVREMRGDTDAAIAVTLR